MNELGDPNGNSWFLIFHHNVKDRELFTNKNEALFCRKKNKFSLLSKLNDNMKKNGDYYEFMITYPEIDDYIHFKQKTNPIYTETIESETVQILHESKCTDHQDFLGLGLSKNGLTYLDGNGKQSNWFYAIGQFAFENKTFTSSIPGPNWYCNNNKNLLLHEVNLYVKVIDWNILQYLYAYKTCRIKNFYSFTILKLLIFIIYLK